MDFTCRSIGDWNNYMKSSNEYEYLPTIEGIRVLANTPSDGNTKNIDQRKKLSIVSATRPLEREDKNIQNLDNIYTNKDTNLDTDEYLDYTVKLVQIKKEDSLKTKNTEGAISKDKVRKFLLKVYIRRMKKYYSHLIKLFTTFLQHAFR